MTTESELEKLFSKALDEVYALRGILASEARIAEAHGELKSFPKSRRRFLDASVERMRRAARGEGERVLYADNDYRFWRQELRNVTGSETLTRWQWESEREGDHE